MAIFKRHDWRGLNSVGTGRGTAERSDGTSYIGGAKQYEMHGDGKITWVEQLNNFRLDIFRWCGAFEGVVWDQTEMLSCACQ
jgi:hypothetical protein